MSVHRGFLVAGLAFVVLGCGTPQQPVKKAPVEVAPSCELTLDNLAGRSFVHVTKLPEGKTYEEDVLARAQFFQDGATLKVKYNTRHITDMYTYDCQKIDEGKKLKCIESNPDAGDYCRTLIANGKECTPEEVSQLSGIPLPQAQKGVKAVKDEMKRLPKKEIDDMKIVFNNPNNQLRGILYVKIKQDECMVTLTDRFETMTFGTMREMENILGSAHFRLTDKNLVFENCVDDKNLIALKVGQSWGKPGVTERDFTVGQKINFRYVGNDEQRPQSGCTYTMDTFVEAEAKGTNVPVGTDPQGRLDWSFSHAFTKPVGKIPFIVNEYRYKACGGDKPKLISVSCQGVVVR